MEFRAWGSDKESQQRILLAESRTIAKATPTAQGQSKVKGKKRENEQQEHART